MALIELSVFFTVCSASVPTGLHLLFFFMSLKVTDRNNQN